MSSRLPYELGTKVAKGELKGKVHCYLRGPSQKTVITAVKHKRVRLTVEYIVIKLEDSTTLLPIELTTFQKEWTVL